MLGICVYFNYDCEIARKWSEETFDHDDWITQESFEECELEGAEIISMITSYLEDRDACSLTFNNEENSITISRFNSMTGYFSDIKITVKKEKQ